MRNRNLFAILSTVTLVSLLLVGCGGTGSTLRGEESDDSSDESSFEEGEEAVEEELQELTVRKVIIPKVAKYVDGVANEAQDSFKEGVIAVYQTPPDFDTALQQFSLAIDQDKEFLEAYFNLGMTYERLNLSA